MLPSALRETPAGVPEAAAAIASLDELLLAGYGRLNAQQKDKLRALSRAFQGSPLGPTVDQAVAALSSGPAMEAQLVAVAAARESLSGAVADALNTQLHSALGRTLPPAPAVTVAPAPAESLPLLANARQWLLELALAGLAQVEPAALAAFSPSLEELQRLGNAAIRPTAVLTGLQEELLGTLPLSNINDAPRQRWGDLWSRALLASLPQVTSPSSSPVKGQLAPIALELRHHRHLLSVVIWGLFTPASGPKALVRATLSGWKVDALSGDEAWWGLLRPWKSVLEPLAKGSALQVEGLLLSTGDLLIHRGSAAGAADPLSTARALDESPVWPSLAPTDRHSAQLGALVLFTTKPSTVEDRLSAAVGDGHIPLHRKRYSPLQGIDIVKLAQCDRWLGLVRWDAGQWTIQPLAGVKTGGKAGDSVGPWEALKTHAGKPSATLSNLSERAGRLLRAKA